GLKEVWGEDANGLLDYVTGWHAKSKDLLSDRPGEFAFVTTNSIAQGQGVAPLFAPLFNSGWVIEFAHRTFAWDSEAPGKAAVHCGIIGFTRDLNVKPLLWDYSHVNGEPEEQTVTRRINGYLVDGPNVLVTRRGKPLSAQLPTANFGTMPLGSALIVEVSEY